MTTKRRRFLKGIKLDPDTTALTEEGELKYDDSSKKVVYRDDSADRSVVSEDGTQSLTNKTMDFTSATGTNTISADSQDIAYDNSVSGLTASDVKAAIDELDSRLEGQDEASEISYDNSTSGLTATDVQAAIDEVEGRVDTIEGNYPVGAIVGTTDTQTLTNKTIDADLNTLSNIDNDEIKAAAAIDVTKLADGSVDNTEFQHLDGVTSNIQTQLDAKLDDFTSNNDNRVVTTDGLFGNALQETVVVINDIGIMSGITDLRVDDLQLDGDTIQTTAANGSININANGTGDINLTADDVLITGNQRTTGTITRDFTVSAVTGANQTISAPTTKNIRLTGSGLSSIDGVVAGLGGQEIVLVNLTGGIVSLNNDTGATAANRILTGTSAPVQLRNEASIPLVYDASQQRWMVAAGVGGGDGVTRNFASLIKNADTTSGWTTGQSATFNASGTLGATFAVDSVNPLFGTSSLALTNLSANDWIAFRDLPIDDGARGKLLGFEIQYTYNGTGIALLKVLDGDGNELDEDQVQIFDTTNDSSNSRQAKVIWVQPQSGTASETITIGMHFPGATGTEDFKFDEIIVSDSPTLVVESQDAVIQHYSAIILNSGSASVVSSGPNDWIQSVSRTGTGDVTINFLPGLFTQSPSIHVTDNDTGNGANVNCTTTNQTSSQVIVRARNTTNGAGVDADFSITATPQGDDVPTPTSSRYLVDSGERLNNSFSAVVDVTGGGATITSQGPIDFIESVTRTVTGRTSVVFKSGFFTVAPSIGIDMNSASVNRISTAANITTSGFTIATNDAVSYAAVDEPVSFTVTRQGDDAVVGMGLAALAGKTHEDDSSILLRGSTGYGSAGSSNVAVFTTVENNLGDAVTYNSDSVNGDSVTINQPGLYHLQGCTAENANFNLGISKNGTILTGSIAALPQDQLPFGISQGNANRLNTISGTTQLEAGDVIRVQGSANSPVSTPFWRLSVSRIGQQPLLDAGEVVDPDASKSNVFSAFITNGGSAAIQSQGKVPWIQSVTRTSAGIVNVVFRPGFFSVQPAILMTVNDPVSTNMTSTTFPNGTVSVQCISRLASSGINFDTDFTVTAIRQGADAFDLTDRVQKFSSAVYRKGTSVYLKDSKPSGSGGGSFSSGSWITRTLNTIEGDSSLVSLSSNQFELKKKGTYEIEAVAPGYRVDFHKIKIRNITDSTDVVIGSSELSNAVDASTTMSTLKGVFSISGAKTFELQHRCSQTDANGLGRPCSFGVNEVYAQVKITKVG